MAPFEGEHALETAGLGLRYRRGRALNDCSLRLPTGSITALVGPNGAGKSTLLSLAAGLLTPTEGRLTVLGQRPGPATVGTVAFLDQAKPLYPFLTVAETLQLGRRLNPSWDAGYARQLVDQAGLPLAARVRTLSGGQRTRLAIALAFGRRPNLLLLDEPLADLDPLARREVMQLVLSEVAESGTTLVISSHVLSDVDGIADYLVLLNSGRVQLSGATETLVEQHALLVGPAPDGELDLGPHTVVEARTTGRQLTALVRTAGPLDLPGWAVQPPTLEELVLAYLRSPAAPAARPVSEVVS